MSRTLSAAVALPEPRLARAGVWYEPLIDRGLIPDPILRAGIRHRELVDSQYDSSSGNAVSIA